MVPADSHKRGCISESVAWGCAAASCVALAALGFVSLAWPSESPLSSARSQSTGFSFPGNPVPADLALVLVVIVALMAVLCRSAVVLARLTWHHRVDYAGSMACVMAASLALGPMLVRLIRQPSMTRAIPLAVFLSAVICAVSAAYVQYASSYRMTVTLARFCIAVGILVAAVCSCVIMGGAPVSVAAALCSVGGVWYVHAQANVILRVPDRYLLEWQRYMTHRWTVRGPIPEQSRPLYTHDIAEDMDVFGAEYTLGLVISHLFIVSGFAVLCLSLPERPNLFVTIGFGAYAVLLPCYLLLRPRTASSVLERMMMRSCAMLVAVMSLLTLAGHDDWRWLTVYVAFGLLALGLVVAASTLVLPTGFKSLMMSRMADWMTSLSLALMGVAAFLASDAMNMIRGFMS